MSFLWELHQQERIGAVRAAAQDARQRASNAEQEIDLLRADLDRLHLVTQAMWTLLQEKSGLTDEDLAERVRQVDLTDGKLDGRVRQQAAPCPQCGRMVSRKRPRCMYCGAELQVGPL